MELIEQSHKIWGISPSTYDEAMLWIERAARNCYASQDKIKPGSAEKLIDGIMKSDPPHSSVLEHVSIYAIREGQIVPYDQYFKSCLKSKWLHSEFNEIALKGEMRGIKAYGNLRAWMEALRLKHPREVYAWLEQNGFIIIDNATVPDFAKRITVELTTDRAVLAEITRHRADVAFSVESQRYVNYDDGITFVKPSWYVEVDYSTQHEFEYWCRATEKEYKELRAKGLPPQHSRIVLNQQVKTTIVMSAYLPEWEWIFKLRTGSGAYPQMINLMQPVEAEFKERGW